MDTKIIPITDFIRRFGAYADLLPHMDKLILTRQGRPFAEVRATAQEKNRKLLKFAGVWKGTKLDDDAYWKKVLSRKSRKPIVKL